MHCTIHSMLRASCSLRSLTQSDKDVSLSATAAYSLLANMFLCGIPEICRKTGPPFGSMWPQEIRLVVRNCCVHVDMFWRSLDILFIHSESYANTDKIWAETPLCFETCSQNTPKLNHTFWYTIYKGVLGTPTFSDMRTLVLQTNQLLYVLSPGQSPTNICSYSAL